MPRRKANPAPSVDEAAPPLDNQEEPQSSEPQAPTQERISIPITPEGRIDFGSMREKTRERLASAIRASGIESVGASADFSEEEAKMLLTMFAGAEAFAVSVRYGLPASEAGMLCAYDPKQMELLSGPLSRVMNKYGGGALGRYRDEITLAAMFLYVEGLKFMRISAYMEQRSQSQQRSAEDARATAAAAV